MITDDLSQLSAVLERDDRCDGFINLQIEGVEGLQPNWNIEDLIRDFWAILKVCQHELLSDLPR
jgi:hypothetical protein